jgi:hypothetical protein
MYDRDGNFIRAVNIDKVIPGCYVKTRDEKTQCDIFVKVVANHDHGEVPIFKITLEGGEEIRCSMHHKFRTTCGEMMPLWYILQEELEIATVGRNSVKSRSTHTISNVQHGLNDILWELTMSGVKFADISDAA